jgi:hypothetical protein
MTHHTDWPASPLQAAGRAFDLLTAVPTVHLFDANGFAGLPQRELELPALRRVLLSASTTPAQRDAVWRHLVDRARRDDASGRTSTVLTVGLALPGLTRIAGRLARGWRGDVADLDGEILAGFLLRLRTLDTDGQRVLGRLLDASIRAGRRARQDAGDGESIRVHESWSTPPAQPWAHPDWVLARAVAAGVLDRIEAELIGATRLDDVTLTQAAHALDIAVPTALGRRRQAEARLAAAITAGDLEHVRLTPRPSRARCPVVHRSRASSRPVGSAASSSPSGARP